MNTPRADALALRVCIDRNLCLMGGGTENPSLVIRKGARILSTATHLRGRIARDATAVQYTAKRDFTLLVSNSGMPTRDKTVLEQIAFKTSSFTPTDRRRAQRICGLHRVDGWIVTRRHRKGEAVVLIDPRKCLA